MPNEISPARFRHDFQFVGSGALADETAAARHSAKDPKDIVQEVIVGFIDWNPPRQLFMFNAISRDSAAVGPLDEDRFRFRDWLTTPQSMFVQRD